MSPGMFLRCRGQFVSKSDVMGLKAWVRKRKKWLLKAAFMLILLGCCCFIYSRYIAPTRVALINFPAYQASSIALANDSRMVEVDVLKPEDASRVKSYDVALFFGPGLRLNGEQAADIEEAGAKGTAIYTLIFPSGVITNHHVDSLQQQRIGDYYGNGNKRNYRNLLHFCRSELDRCKWFATTAEEPVHLPSNFYWYLGEDHFFTDLDGYNSYYRKNGLYKEGAPSIAIVSGMTSPLSGNRANVDTLVVGLERAGFNVYPLYATGKRLQMLKEISPDAVIYLPMGRLGSDAVVDWLKERNIPLFCPLTLLQERREWEEDPRGLAGGYLAASMVLPEIDGGTRSQVLSVQNADARGYYQFVPVADRVENLVEGIRRQIALQQKANRDKRLAIVYLKGPGQTALTAAGLEVAPSLYALLKRLKAEGYLVENIPATEREFEALLQREGSVFASYAKGRMAEFMATAHPGWIRKSDYETWAKEVLTPEKYAEVVGQYGEAPGEYMSGEQGGEPALAFSCLHFGHVVLLPQPAAAAGENEFQIVHGAEVAPPHAYIAPYLWIQKGFQADALIHFGTHGSLEFTPGKQVGLSAEDWPDRLIGTIPHFYYYTIANVGEGIVAKRRTYASLVSYLTPPFMESCTRGHYEKLFRLITDYDCAAERGQLALALKIKEQVVSLGLHHDLQLDSVATKPCTEEEIRRVESFAEEIANEKMTGRLYILGNVYSKEDIRATVVAMCAEPLAYSFARLDRQKGRITAAQYADNVFVSRRYLSDARTRVEELLHTGKKLTLEQLGISREDVIRARTTEMAVNPRQLSMSEMMAMASESGNNISEGVKKSERGMKMPAEMPKVGKMPDWVKKRIEARKKAEREGKKVEIPEVPVEEKEFAQAVGEIRQVVENAERYARLLQESPQQEMLSLLNALNGGYVEPSPGGDAVRNPNTLPTGRNLFAVNAESTPGIRAWDEGKALAQKTLDQYYQKHGTYPRKVSYTFWAGEFIETEGATLAQALYMLGVVPVRDGMNRVTDLQLIPSAELGRPRIDIVVQTSGQLRDVAASRLELLTKAVAMAAQVKNDTCGNYVAIGTVESERILLDKGLSPKEARELSLVRVFGGAGYGTGITGLVEKGDAWQQESEIADRYLSDMGMMYGNGKTWGNYRREAFEAALHNADVVIQPRQSNTWGALSLDHVYEFMGGLNLTVRHVTGKDPDTYLSDYRNRNCMRIQELKEAIGVEGRTTIFNPAYIREKMKGGASSAAVFGETIRNTYGWNVMNPAMIGKDVWDRIYEVYVKDKYDLGLHRFFEAENPAALQEITAVMLEIVRKGYWKATDGQVKDIAGLHTRLLEEYKPACSGFVCDNLKLQEFISQHIEKNEADTYRENISKIREIQAIHAQNTVVLKKEQLNRQQQSGSDTEGNRKFMFVSILVAGIALTLFVLIRRRRR